MANLIDKVIVYNQLGNIYYKTINNQRVPFVNVRVFQKAKATKGVIMRLEKFNKLGYEKDPNIETFTYRRIKVTKKGETREITRIIEKMPQTIGVIKNDELI